MAILGRGSPQSCLLPVSQPAQGSSWSWWSGTPPKSRIDDAAKPSAKKARNTAKKARNTPSPPPAASRAEFAGPTSQVPLPPPPQPTRMLTVTLHKYRASDKLGIRFEREAEEDGGVLVRFIEAGLLAYRSALRPGDVVVAVESNGVETAVDDGLTLASLLRPAKGALIMRVRRRRPTRREAAATRIAAAFRTLEARTELLDAIDAAVTLQAAWRRCAAETERECSILAITYIQQVWRLRASESRRERAASPIRLPPSLDAWD